jgi:hypothetical protein
MTGAQVLETAQDVQSALARAISACKTFTTRAIKLLQAVKEEKSRKVETWVDTNPYFTKQWRSSEAKENLQGIAHSTLAIRGRRHQTKMLRSVR